MPTFNREDPSPLEDLFHETVNKTIKNMASIDNYHGDENHVVFARFPLLMCCITCLDIELTNQMRTAFKALVEFRGAGHVCLNLNFRQNFP